MAATSSPESEERLANAAEVCGIELEFWDARGSRDAPLPKR
jgi:hypothetical protein